MVTIVVVEPDLAVRMLFSEWLAADGYTVKQFGQLPPPGALALAQVLIIDLPSPRLPQPATFADMHASHPGLIAIGLSTSLSRSLGGDSAFARSMGLASVLPKPCDRRELLGVVHDVLGRHAA
jgi:DNA-binding NtrC family response regulator